jgi:colanic acid/amylovoran biosynthesis glycosyltransferase
MKIALLVNEFPSSSETFIQSQITGLLDRGHDVTIYTGRIRRDLGIHDDLKQYNLLGRTICPAIPQQKSIRVLKGLRHILRLAAKHPLPIIRSLNVFRYQVDAASLTLLYHVIPFLEHGPYDLIHCQFGTLGLQELRIKQVLGGKPKLVTSFRGFDATMTVHNQAGCYKELFAEGELFLPVCHSLKKRIVDQGCPEDKIVVLPSGIDCEKFPYSLRTVGQGEPVRAITVGRLVEKKGIAYGIEAVARVISSGRCAAYDIVGEGVLRGQLERLIEERGMQAHIRLLGQRTHDETIRLLQGAHILIAPSVTAADGDQEGIPNVLKEAMALGLPVISTRHSGIPELVEDGVSGYLVNERDVDALADRLSYLIDHPEKWAEMGKAGRACVETNYDIKTLNDRLVGLYERVCHGELIHGA